MKTVVLMPVRPDGAYRDEVRAWILDRWAREHPTWSVHVGIPDDGPFNRSQAINRASADAGPWDVAVIADADSFCGADQVRKATKLAAQTGEMIIAYDAFHYLKPRGSRAIMEGHSGNWWPFVYWTMPGTCSSMITVNRDLWDTVGGFDECFRGWGFEDVGFFLACQGTGGQRRIKGDCWHLWHPPSTENNQSEMWEANRQRMERYADALRADAMPAFLALPPEQR